MNCPYCNALSNLPEEEFRPVVGFEEKYFVSNLGRVIRHKAAKNHRRCCVFKLRFSRKGYPVFARIINRKPTETFVHQAVAAAFIGPCPTGCQVNHKDGVKGNNNVSNLEYVTQKENMQHAARMGLCASGDRHGSKTKLERWRRGDNHPFRLNPECVPRGDRSGARTKPESLPRGEKAGSAKLTDLAIKEIRQLAKKDVRKIEIAKLFNVHLETIRRVLKGQTWGHVF